MAAAVVLVSVYGVQLIHGNIFRIAFEAPLDEWGTTLASSIGNEPSIAQRAAKAHNIGVVVINGDQRFAFAPGGEPVEAETLVHDSSSYRMIEVLGPDNRRTSFYLKKSDAAGTHYGLLMILIVFLLIIIGVVYAIQLRQLRPLQWLRNAVDAVSEGDFSAKVPVAGNNEIGQVGEAFNHMTAQVQQMMDDRERLLADVSHELRSPLARMRVALELMPEGDKRDAIARDVREMTGLITVLLERERARARLSHLQTEPVDLTALTRSVIESMDQRPGIVLDGQPNPSVKADPALLRVLLQNLLSNAVKFSLPDSRAIKVTLTRHQGGIEILIVDDGMGIPPDQAKRVLEPFVKLDPARGHRAGYGLGLNLCQRIVQAHRGRIEIEPSPPRGTCVRVWLPAVSEAP